MTPLPPRPLLMMVAELEPALEFKVWQAVQGAVDMVLLRAREADLASLRNAVATIRIAGITIPVMVNAGSRKVQIAGASGYHFPEAAMSQVEGLQKRLCGVSVHSPEAAAAAETLGASYVLAGTIFKTKSHPDQQGGGTEQLSSICKATKLPVIAIGGITPENARPCIEAGAYGVAVLSPFKVPDRKLTAQAYKAAMAG